MCSQNVKTKLVTLIYQGVNAQTCKWPERNLFDFQLEDARSQVAYSSLQVQTCQISRTAVIHIPKKTFYYYYIDWEAVDGKALLFRDIALDLFVYGQTFNH